MSRHVDASVAIRWLVREERADKGLAILSQWHDADVTLGAPLAGHRGKHRSRLDLPQTTELHTRALELATELKCGAVHDAHCLALAEDIGCELWTAGQGFHRAAQGPGNVRWTRDWAISR